MFSWKPEAMTPTAVLPFNIWWACVLFNRVIFGFRQSCKMIHLHPIHHTTLPQPSQKWSANHFTIVWLMCRLFKAGHHLQEPVTRGGQAGSVTAAPEFATWYEHNTTSKNTEILHLRFSGSPSTYISYKVVCSQAGNDWTSELSIFNSCISKSTISPSQLSFKLNRCPSRSGQIYQKPPNHTK